jgi:hypothetical protein
LTTLIPATAAVTAYVYTADFLLSSTSGTIFPEDQPCQRGCMYYVGVVICSFPRKLRQTTRESAVGIPPTSPAAEDFCYFVEK